MGFRFFALAILTMIYYAQSMRMWSPESITKYLQDKGNVEVSYTYDCHHYEDDLKAEVTSFSPRGNFTIAGGKDVFCQDLSTRSMEWGNSAVAEPIRIEELVISKPKFPWLEADVKYVERQDVTVDGNTLYRLNRYDLKMRRTVFGRRIFEIKADNRATRYKPK